MFYAIIGKVLWVHKDAWTDLRLGNSGFVEKHERQIFIPTSIFLFFFSLGNHVITGHKVCAEIVLWCKTIMIFNRKLPRLNTSELPWITSIKTLYFYIKNLKSKNYQKTLHNNNEILKNS